MNNLKLKVNEVAKEIGETVHVVRNWTRDFRNHIPIEKSEAGYNLFTEDAVAVLRKIKQLIRDQKYSTKQVEHYFSNAGAGFGETIEDKERSDKLDEIIKRLDRQDEFNKALLERMESFVRERDEKLTATLREIQETKRLQQRRGILGFFKSK